MVRIQAVAWKKSLLIETDTQGKAKKTRKFAAVKRMLNPNDIRLCVSLCSIVTPYLTTVAQKRKSGKTAEERGRGQSKGRATCVRTFSSQRLITFPPRSRGVADSWLCRIGHKSHHHCFCNITTPLYRHIVCLLIPISSTSVFKTSSSSSAE